MTANNKKSYLWCLNYQNEYNNSYHRFIYKKHIDFGYSTFTAKVKTSPKAPKLKVGDRVSITKNKNIFSKGFTKNWSKKIFFLILYWKLITNPSIYKIKDLNGEKIKGSFYVKELFVE